MSGLEAVGVHRPELRGSRHSSSQESILKSSGSAGHVYHVEGGAPESQLHASILAKPTINAPGRASSHPAHASPSTSTSNSHIFISSTDESSGSHSGVASSDAHSPGIAGSRSSKQFGAGPAAGRRSPIPNPSTGSQRKSPVPIDQKRQAMMVDKKGFRIMASPAVATNDCNSSLSPEYRSSAGRGQRRQSRLSHAAQTLEVDPDDHNTQSGLDYGNQLGSDDIEDQADDDGDSRSTGSSAEDMQRMEQFQKMQMFLEQLSLGTLDAVIMIDDRGIIKSMNQKFLDMFGYRRWELVGKNISIIVPHDLRAKHDFFLKRYLKSRCKRIIGEVRDGIMGVKKDGTYFPVVLRTSEIEDDEGRIAFYGILRDMSEHISLRTIATDVGQLVISEVLHCFRSGDLQPVESMGTVGRLCITGFSSDRDTFVEQMTRLVNLVDDKCTEYGVHRLLGMNGYFALSCGVPVPYGDHPVRILEVLVETLRGLPSISADLSLCGGVHTGRLFGGVEHGERIAYTVIGEPMTLSQTLMDICPQGTIAVSESTFSQTAHRHTYKPVGPGKEQKPTSGASWSESSRIYLWQHRGRQTTQA